MSTIPVVCCSAVHVKPTSIPVSNRNRLPAASAVEAADAYSHAQQHSRVALARTAEVRLLQKPVGEWRSAAGRKDLSAFAEPVRDACEDGESH